MSPAWLWSWMHPVSLSVLSPHRDCRVLKVLCPELLVSGCHLGTDQGGLSLREKMRKGRAGEWTKGSPNHLDLPLALTRCRSHGYSRVPLDVDARCSDHSTGSGGHR
jgi:hypothetical protein